jgi:hypothetical protein
MKNRLGTGGSGSCEYGINIFNKKSGWVQGAPGGANLEKNKNKYKNIKQRVGYRGLWVVRAWKWVMSGHHRRARISIDREANIFVWVVYLPSGNTILTKGVLIFALFSLGKGLALAQAK